MNCGGGLGLNEVRGGLDHANPATTPDQLTFLRPLSLAHSRTHRDVRERRVRLETLPTVVTLGLEVGLLLSLFGEGVADDRLLVRSKIDDSSTGEARADVGNAASIRDLVSRCVSDAGESRKVWHGDSEHSVLLQMICNLIKFRALG